MIRQHSNLDLISFIASLCATVFFLGLWLRALGDRPDYAPTLFWLTIGSGVFAIGTGLSYLLYKQAESEAAAEARDEESD